MRKQTFPFGIRGNIPVLPLDGNENLVLTKPLPMNYLYIIHLIA